MSSPNNWTPLKRRLVAACARRGWDLQRLAKEAGIKRERLSEMCSGRRRYPKHLAAVNAALERTKQGER